MSQHYSGETAAALPDRATKRVHLLLEIEVGKAAISVRAAQGCKPPPTLWRADKG